MQIEQHQLEGDVLKVVLDGSFDIAGAGDVDVPFSVIAGSRGKVVIDFAGVDFLASIGVRVLVKSAKAMANRGGRMAVFGANAAAAKVLASTGADTIIDVVSDERAAVAAVS